MPVRQIHRRRSRRSRSIGAIIAASVLLAFAGGASASAAPIWSLDVHHGPTNFPPDGTGEYWFTIANIGNEPSSGPVILTLRLPPGLTRASVSAAGWTCPGFVGDAEVICTTEAVFAPGSVELGVPGADPLTVSVDVDPSYDGQTLPVSASIGGGGTGVSAVEVEMTRVSSALVPFGIVPGSLEADFINADGTPERKSGGSPDLAIFSFDFNNAAEPRLGVPYRKAPVEAVRDFELALPPGLTGDPSAAGECTPAQLVAQACPVSSSVGRIDLGIEPLSGSREGRFFELASASVYSMDPPKGYLADFAFNVSDNVTHLRVSLDPADNYATKISVPLVNQFAPVYFQRLTLWNASPESALFTMPSTCGVDQVVSLRHYDSWQQPGVFGPEVSYRLPGPLTGCDQPRFEPTLAVSSTDSRASAPTGIEARLGLPQAQGQSAPASPPVEDVHLVFPDGMALSPAFANGLTSCSEAQIGLGSGRPVECPDSSRVGAATLGTPLLSQPLEGTVYLAAQEANPFGSLLGVYLVVQDVEDRGVLLKVPGRIDLDPDDGRVSMRLEDLPPLPFDQLSLRFRGGGRSPLVNPPGCGASAIAGTVSSYARPGDPVPVADTYEVTAGPEGGPCLAPGAGPFAPRLVAGAVNPRAASATPFVIALTRDDREQQLHQVELSPPPGLAAKLAGIPACPNPPACSPAGQVGTALVGVGTGPEPLYLPGKIYLGGPYRGAPFSLVVVVPASAGPLDLGYLTTRVAIHVHPITARLRAVVDPLPRIRFGIPLAVRELRIDLDRRGFTVNPTSCDPMAVIGEAVSRQGTQARISTRFQLASCERLGFGPSLSLKLAGPAHKGAHPALRAAVVPRRGDANIRRLGLVLPRTELLDSRHIRGVCSRSRFAASRCPGNSIYGHAVARSPLLERPLRGPVYLRESDHRLPDLVASLDGRFDIDLVARMDSVGGRVRLSFAKLPDVPVRKLVLSMAGGRQGLLVNTGHVCSRTRRAAVVLVGHNAKRHDAAPMVRTECARNQER